VLTTLDDAGMTCSPAFSRSLGDFIIASVRAFGTPRHATLLIFRSHNYCFCCDTGRFSLEDYWQRAYLG
jgi:hypothetical protein